MTYNLISVECESFISRNVGGGREWEWELMAKSIGYKLCVRARIFFVSFHFHQPCYALHPSPSNTKKSNSAYAEILINYLKSNAYVKRLPSPSRKKQQYHLILPFRLDDGAVTVCCMHSYYVLVPVKRFCFSYRFPFFATGDSIFIKRLSLQMMWVTENMALISDTFRKMNLDLFTFYCFHSKQKILLLWIFVWIYMLQNKQRNANWRIGRRHWKKITSPLSRLHIIIMMYALCRSINNIL